MLQLQLWDVKDRRDFMLYLHLFHWNWTIPSVVWRLIWLVNMMMCIMCVCVYTWWWSINISTQIYFYEAACFCLLTAKHLISPFGNINVFSCQLCNLQITCARLDRTAQMGTKMWPYFQSEGGDSYLSSESDSAPPFSALTIHCHREVGRSVQR